ncbi:MAG: GNAT family N-acetyltransferase [Anaerolineales bacterium]
MAAPAVLEIRPAVAEDRSKLANLLHFETYVHRHLDWRRPLEWLGDDPFLIVETGDRITGALACPPDPPEVSWIRLFAANSRGDVNEVWSKLWKAALDRLSDLGVRYIPAIPLQEWFRKLLENSGFKKRDKVVVLDWAPAGRTQEEGTFAANIRPMSESDLEAVHKVDNLAFSSLWQHSHEAVELAFEQSAVATLIEENGQVASYQISTQSPQGLHLARLATHPKFQGRGLAKALVRDLMSVLKKRGENRLTVNTQASNRPSLALYEKMKFKPTTEEFPVYVYDLKL